MLLEVAPLLWGGLAVSLLGARRAATVEKAAVGPGHVALADGEIRLGGGQRSVSEDACGDVEGQAAGDGLALDDALVDPPAGAAGFLDGDVRRAVVEAAAHSVDLGQHP
ncbi:hypothetical protein ACIG0A_00235 [Streptomyces californicus]|uniref:hypothetical protein n=1 Tax=Streptomyces californicus TaxID=67351 RepID=UPI0037D62B82